jgi:cyclopropane-fatty-acyl-phospholipid synthase
MPEALAQSLVCSVFQRIENGQLILRLPKGGERHFGDPARGPTVRVDVLHPRFFRRVCLGGDIGFGDAYLHGDFETDDLTELLRLFVRNPALARDDAVGTSFLVRGLHRLLHAWRRNSVRNSRGNIMAHYDLGNDFYRRLLDASMIYSCAVFQDPQDCLNTGQHRKLDTVADLADVQPGDRLLEIGCGWGGFATRIAGQRGARVHGITLSPSQLAWARRQADEAGVGDRVEFELRDYRHLEGRYDRIASIEMLEAVGPQYLGAYFARCAAALRSGGRAALQVITIPDARYAAYRKSCDWIQKRVFPGGFLPSLGALQEAVRESPSLVLEQVSSIGSHYARTLQEWRARFHRHWPEIREWPGFDDRFRRLWDYYLSYCEAGFSTGFIDVHHLTLRAR